MQQAIWRWFKRGLLGLIALFALLVIGLGFFLMKERHRLAEFNRTHERPLFDGTDNAVRADAHIMLSSLKPTAAEDSLRFAVMPSFGKRWFALSVSITNERGEGEAIVSTPTGGLLRHQKFEVPRDELRLFLSQWDEITDGYTGEGRMLTDGNPLAFERRRIARVTSGVGNSPCHYDVLGDLAAQTFGRFVPELSDLRDPTLPWRLKSKFCNRSIYDLR